MSLLLLFPSLMKFDEVCSKQGVYYHFTIFMSVGWSFTPHWWQCLVYQYQQLLWPNSTTFTWHTSQIVDVSHKNMRNMSQVGWWCHCQYYLVRLTFLLHLYVLLLSSQWRARACQIWSGGVHGVLCDHLYHQVINTSIIFSSSTKTVGIWRARISSYWLDQSSTRWG